VTLSYDELVTAATVGITRKPLTVTGLGGPAAGYEDVLDAHDPAAALLDAAALLTVARRAGVQPERGVAVQPPPAEPAPALSARAEAALRALRWSRYPRRYIYESDADLLAALVGAAADAGYVAPGQLLADLLDAAAGDPTLRPAVARVLGTRGRWLAQYNPAWRDIVAAAEAMADPETWRTGAPAERLAYLSALRDRDPAAARDLLAASWAQEHGRDRARFLTVLSRNLSPGDEEFLEAALNDRAPTVQVPVRQMLARIPGSAFLRRGSERAAGLLRLDGDGSGLRLAARVPGEPDRAAARDGIGGTPPTPQIRPEVWYLTQLLSAAPLSDWTARFGLGAREIVALPVDEDLRADVHAGWRFAAVRERDSEWARALLGADRPDDSGERPPEAWPPDHVLTAALPPGEWAALMLADVRLFYSYTGGSSHYRLSDRHDHMLAEVATCAPPWPANVADAVIAAIDREAAPFLANARPWSLYMRPAAAALLHAAGACMPPHHDRDYAAELTRIATNMAVFSPAMQKPFTSAARAITARRAFYEEIS
jgi:hypothetical protein